MTRVAAALGAALALSVGVAACGEEEPSPEKDRKAIAALFDELDRVQREGDAEQACEKVFLVQETAEALREEEAEREREEQQEGAESPAACRTAFERGLGTRAAQVRSIRTRIRSIALEGDRATARLSTTVVRMDGSSFANEFDRDLVRRGEDWRIRISPEG